MYARKVLRFARWGVIFMLALRAGSARADATDPPSAEALFRAARQSQTAGDIGKACDLFEESYRLDPAGGTLLNLAACEERAGRITKAWELYRRVVDTLPAGDDRIALAEAREKELAPR